MKVGDYVRTKSGGIGKTIEIDNNASCSHIITDNETFGLGWDGEQVNWDFITEIVKSSPNIKCLIQEDDYINGEKVTNINGILYVKNIGALEEINIKSIVTKEQFKDIEYRIGE